MLISHGHLSLHGKEPKVVAAAAAEIKMKERKMCEFLQSSSSRLSRV